MNRLVSAICILAACSWMDGAVLAQERGSAASRSAEPAEIKALIDRAEQVLHSRRGDVSAVLSEPNYMPAHAWPRFREIIKRHALGSSITIVTPQEPGRRMRVRLCLVEQSGSACAGAEVYFYQTDAGGEYGPNPARVPPASDNNYARLFGYVVTDSEGKIEIQTIRPGGYPGTDVPEHIHLRIWCRDKRSFGGEIWFEDDPRVGREARAEAARIPRIVICPVAMDAQGQASIEARIRLD